MPVYNRHRENDSRRNVILQSVMSWINDPKVVILCPDAEACYVMKTSARDMGFDLDRMGILVQVENDIPDKFNFGKISAS